MLFYMVNIFIQAVWLYEVAILISDGVKSCNEMISHGNFESMQSMNVSIYINIICMYVCIYIYLYYMYVRMCMKGYMMLYTHM